MKKVYYVVWVGREPDVYDNWPAAKEQVDGYPGAKCAGGFATRPEAKQALRDGYNKWFNDKHRRGKNGPPLF